MTNYKHKDMRGINLEVGDYIVYGKSDRHNPVKLGSVVSILEDCIEVLGDGNSKTGMISAYNVPRRVVLLPCNYRED